MTLEEAMKAREAAKQRLLDERRRLANAKVQLDNARAEVDDAFQMVPRREREYVYAVNAVKALLDADLAGTMGKPKSEPPAASAVEAHP